MYKNDSGSEGNDHSEPRTLSLPVLTAPSQSLAVIRNTPFGQFNQIGEILAIFVLLYPS